MVGAASFGMGGEITLVDGERLPEAYDYRSRHQSDLPTVADISAELVKNDLDSGHPESEVPECQSCRNSPPIKLLAPSYLHLAAPQLRATIMLAWKDRTSCRIKSHHCRRLPRVMIQTEDGMVETRL